MDREDIIRMAQEAISLKMEDHVWTMSTTHLERFAALVADSAIKPWADQLDAERKRFSEYNEMVVGAMQDVRRDEREACAKVCDVLAVHPEYASDITKLAAQAIRARGNT